MNTVPGFRSASHTYDARPTHDEHLGRRYCMLDWLVSSRKLDFGRSFSPHFSCLHTVPVTGPVFCSIPQHFCVQPKLHTIFFLPIRRLSLTVSLQFVMAGIRGHDVSASGSPPLQPRWRSCHYGLVQKEDDGGYEAQALRCQSSESILMSYVRIRVLLRSDARSVS
eukprot:758663-Pleurochrysis_carterae.AAC.4